MLLKRIEESVTLDRELIVARERDYYVVLRDGGEDLLNGAGKSLKQALERCFSIAISEDDNTLKVMEDALNMSGWFYTIRVVASIEITRLPKPFIDDSWRYSGGSSVIGGLDLMVKNMRKMPEK